MDDETTLLPKAPEACQTFSGKGCKILHEKRPVVFSSGNCRTFGVRARPASLLLLAEASRLLDAQKSSGTLSRSILNEYTDCTNPDRAFVSNQDAEHHGY
jgi:hypothetical protein